MKYSLDLVQQKHFARSGMIECEDFLSQDERLELLQSLKATFDLRLKQGKTSIQSWLEAGRDLFRDAPILPKNLFTSKYLSLAKEALGATRVRYIFDQWLPPVFPNSLDPHLSFFSEEHTLSSFSSLQGDFLAFCICLDGPFVEESTPNDSIFPQNPGSAVIFNEKKSFNLKQGILGLHKTYIFFVVGKMKVTYVHNAANPITHYLKSHGYSYGDTLLESSHPTH